MQEVLIAFIAIELLAVIYYLYLTLEHAKNIKQLDRTDEVKSTITNLVQSVSKEIEKSRSDIASRIVPTESTVKIDELKSELNIAASHQSPRCQFCGSVLGKVKRRPDGYMCCSACSIKHFASAQ